MKLALLSKKIFRPSLLFTKLSLINLLGVSFSVCRGLLSVWCVCVGGYFLKSVKVSIFYFSDRGGSEIVYNMFAWPL